MLITFPQSLEPIRIPRPNFQRHGRPEDINDLQHLAIVRDNEYLLLQRNSEEHQRPKPTISFYPTFSEIGAKVLHLSQKLTFLEAC